MAFSLRLLPPPTANFAFFVVGELPDDDEYEDSESLPLESDEPDVDEVDFLAGRPSAGGVPGRRVGSAGVTPAAVDFLLRFS